MSVLACKIPEEWTGAEDKVTALHGACLSSSRQGVCMCGCGKVCRLQNVWFDAKMYGSHTRTA